MKKALIICGEMPSSLLVKNEAEHFASKGIDITLDAIAVTSKAAQIVKAEFDLYLVSPQTRIYEDTFKKEADKLGKPLDHILSQADILIPMGTLI